jgi:translocation and assembly module TamA
VSKALRNSGGNHDKRIQHSAIRLLVRALVLLTVSAALGACALLPQSVSERIAPAAAPVSGLRLVVQAPPELQALLEKHLDLARLQLLRGDEVIDDDEWARLAAAAPAQARELLQTEGYFDAKVSVRRQVDGIGSAALQRVDLTVDPGPRTQVTSLEVETTGDLQRRAALGEVEAVALIQALADSRDDRVGKPFRNSDWAGTKQKLLLRLSAAGYAAPRLVDTQAVIDTPSHSAALTVKLDSGPLFLAGSFKVEGLQHHDKTTVLNLAGFGIGTPLTEARLLDYQERLQKARLFETVGISFDPDPQQADAVVVRVRLVELPLQQITVGLGISDSTGPRATLEHIHRRLLGLPVIAHNKFEWGRDSQKWAGDFQTHPAEGFYRNLFGVQIENIKSSTDVVLSQRLRLGRTQDTPRIERLYFAELLRSRQIDNVPMLRSAAASPNTATALSANYHWVWRDLDSVLLPTRGITWAVQLAAGQATSLGGVSGPFSRLYSRVTGYLPIGENWYGQARLEAGQIIKNDAVTVPDALGFRAGGDDSVRGYGYRTLAPVGADGGTLSGRSLLTGSLELAHPILASLPALWGAVFIDAGRAVDHWADYKPALGYGLGLRYRSPIGPLKIDLAYGEELKKVRLHFSVGIAF